MTSSPGRCSGSPTRRRGAAGPHAVHQTVLDGRQLAGRPDRRRPGVGPMSPDPPAVRGAPRPPVAGDPVADVVWCLLWGEFTVGNILAGLVVAGGDHLGCSRCRRWPSSGRPTRGSLVLVVRDLPSTWSLEPAGGPLACASARSRSTRAGGPAADPQRVRHVADRRDGVAGPRQPAHRGSPDPVGAADPHPGHPDGPPSRRHASASGHRRSGSSRHSATPRTSPVSAAAPRTGLRPGPGSVDDVWSPGWPEACSGVAAILTLVRAARGPSMPNRAVAIDVLSRCWWAVSVSRRRTTATATRCRSSWCCPRRHGGSVSIARFATEG